MKPCVRERETGKNFLTGDDGSSDFMCCKCLFSERCHKEVSSRDTLRMFEAK